MSKAPKIVEKRCEIVDLQKGTYHWCACGESKKQPFCDGSHKGTEITPIKFEVTEEGPVKMCLCKHSKKGPYCDGSHGKL